MIKDLVIAKDYESIKSMLAANAALANDGIPYDEKNPVLAHPLHRICDAVFAGLLTDDEAVAIASLFLKNGANVNGNDITEGKDSPLTAAASLHADKVAMLYIDNGADIHHAGCHGGTALHWAAWCGRSNLVKKLVQQGAAINQLCIDFKSTPLFWAVHGLKNGGYHDINSCIESTKILLEAGAGKSIPNAGGNKPADLLSDDDEQLKELLN